MAKKPSEFIDWRYNDGEVIGSYNINVLAEMTPSEIAKQHPQYFANYGDEARTIRIAALHTAVKDAKFANDKINAPEPAAKIDTAKK